MPIPRPTSLLLRFLALAGSTALVLGLSATAAPAAPAPTPRTAADALTQMRVLYQQFATAAEAFHESETVLARRTAQAKAATARAAAATRATEAYRLRIRQLVRSESRSTPFQTFGAMLTSGSRSDFAAQASLLEVVATRRSAVVEEAAKAAAAATRAQAEARTAAESAAALTRELGVERTKLSRQAAQAAALYRRLSAQERAALAAAQTQRAAAERASRAASRTSPAPTPAPAGTARPTAAPSPPPSSPAPAPPAAVPVSGRASIAVAEARRQIGKPYVWGSAGPNSFDCSGLTSWSWRAAGVILPRTSRQQYAAGVKVTRSALRPGDLVYFGSPIYHVAIYVGGNTMISAPQPGDVVKYQSLDAFGDYAGATRPG